MSQTHPHPPEGRNTARGGVLSQSVAPGETFALVIPAPCDWINANQRMHWAPKNRLTQTWKQAAVVYARQARLPKVGRVSVTMLVHKTSRRQYDAHNLYPTAKAVMDGLVVYGLIPDDSNEFLAGPDMRAGEVRARPELEVLIRVESGDC